MGATTYTVANTKGGMGKTTLTANLGAHLTLQDKRVLLIDTDQQGSLTNYFPLTAESRFGIYEFIAYPEITDVFSKTDCGCDLIRSNNSNQLDTLLRNDTIGQLKLYQAVERIKANYDYIIIDTPGSSGITLFAAVVAADVVISPLPPQTLAAREFHKGIQQTVVDLNAIRGGRKPVAIDVVICQKDRTNDSSTRSKMGLAINCIVIIQKIMRKIVKKLHLLPIFGCNMNH